MFVGAKIKILECTFGWTDMHVKSLIQNLHMR